MKCSLIFTFIFLLLLSPAVRSGDSIFQGSLARAQSADSESGAGKWLIMLYQDADDQALERDIFIDLNEAEVVGSSERVHIVSQLDRFKGGFDGDGDWTSTKRFYLTKDSDLERLASEELEDLGEANMGDEKTLIDFVTWAIDKYPAERHVLILSDHGEGWPGGWHDPDPEEEAKIWLNEIDAALGQIRAQTGLDKFEMVGFDACLMSHLEVYSAIAPHARYSVASQETEPGIGWAYASFLKELVDDPEMNGSDLSRSIVSSYIIQDERIVDDGARARYVEEQGIEEGVSAKEVAEEMSADMTLSAVDLEALPSLNQAMNSFVTSLSGIDQTTVAAARTYAQSFTSVFGDEVPPSYIDLGHFVTLLKEKSENVEVDEAADLVLAALKGVIVAEKHGPLKPGASGISIYFPNSQLFRSDDLSGHKQYTAIADRFAGESQWDEFLMFHYSGRPLEADDAARPEGEVEINAPGAGNITIDPIDLSADVATEDEPVTMQTQISGNGIGYIFTFTGYYDEETNSILTVDTDFLEADKTEEVNGVYFPNWGDGGTVDIQFDWQPVLFAINDGRTSEFALLYPKEYGGTPEETVYAVEGIYTFTDTGESRYALMYFGGDGEMRQVFGFTGEGGTGAPREIVPRAGDQFTILEEWIGLGEGEDDEVEFFNEEGGTLTFSEENFFWEEISAPPGEYEVGFIVEDLDGNSYEEYVTIVVE